MLATHFIPVLLTFVFWGQVEAGTTDMGCVNACADYSIALGYCRGSFEFIRKPPLSLSSPGPITFAVNTLHDKVLSRTHHIVVFRT